MIYLDNAATSFPKPRRVIDEQARCMRSYCGNPGRASHPLAVAASEKIYECRCELAALFGGVDPASVVFTQNTTAALNTVIKGFLREGDHVLISDLEHNAVFRPVYKLAREGKILFDVFPTDAGIGEIDPERICREIERRIKPRTRMLICTHASNICSAVLPIDAIGALCRARGILFVVDAAQSAGHIDIDLKRTPIDALCAPGHKGLLGPQGTGFFILRPDLRADTLIEGGNGLHSLDGEMSEDVPERYEAGTLATPAIAGLCEGVREVRRRGVERIFAHERELNAFLQDELLRLPRVHVYAPEYCGSVLLFSLDGIAADLVGNALSQYGICVRSGYHCTALGHATLGTPVGGAVRVSTGMFNAKQDMVHLLDAVRQICKA